MVGYLTLRWQSLVFFLKPLNFSRIFFFKFGFTNFFLFSIHPIKKTQIENFWGNANFFFQSSLCYKGKCERGIFWTIFVIILVSLFFLFSFSSYPAKCIVHTPDLSYFQERNEDCINVRGQRYYLRGYPCFP